MNNALADNVVVSVGFAEWLSITGKGILNNISATVPANTQIQVNVNAQPGLQFVLARSIQFDGVLSGQVSYEVNGGQGAVLGSWAVQTEMIELLMVSDKGQPIRITINNGSAQDVLYNIIYLSIKDTTWGNEILPRLDPRPIGTM